MGHARKDHQTKMQKETSNALEGLEKQHLDYPKKMFLSPYCLWRMVFDPNEEATAIAHGWTDAPVTRGA